MNRYFLASLVALSGCAPQSPATSVAAPAAATAPTTPKSASAETVATRTVATRTAATRRDAPQNSARQLSWSVAQSFPHDASAFTQGLLWHDGFLFESTGLEGHSEIRKVDAVSGQVVSRFRLPSPVFGEGMAFLDGKFYSLTWQSGLGFVFDEKFKPLGRFAYRNEGWGLTTDGKKLLQSDGSDILTWRDPRNFAALGQISVTRNGAPLRNLNELEWIEGFVWANVWQTDSIVIIDPKSGIVVAELDLRGLLKAQDRSGREDVLNGIAYDAASGRLFVTGKKWPRLFSLAVEDIPGVSKTARNP